MLNNLRHILFSFPRWSALSQTLCDNRGAFHRSPLIFIAADGSDVSEQRVGGCVGGDDFLLRLCSKRNLLVRRHKTGCVKLRSAALP